MALHNVSDVMGITGIESRTTIYKYIHTGELRALRFGERKYLITSEDLASFLKLKSGEQKW